MGKAYVITKKTDLTPHTLDFTVPDVDDKGKDITRQLTFRCVPTISGDDMLDLAAVQDESFSGGMRAMFAAAIVPDDQKAWAEFLKTPNGPDLDELVEINADLVAHYSSRSDGNPTQGNP